VRSEAESGYAWLRLAASLALMTLGGAGMYAVTVALPPVQAEFGVARSDALLPYTLTMIGFGLGGILMGRLADRFGVIVPVLIGTVCLGLGFIAAGFAGSLWQFALAQGLLIGFLGSSATFAPLVADTSLPGDVALSDTAIVRVPLRVAAGVAASADGRRSLGDMWAMSRALSRPDADVIFFPTVYSYVPVFSRVPIVVGGHTELAARRGDAVGRGDRAIDPVGAAVGQHARTA